MKSIFVRIVWVSALLAACLLSLATIAGPVPGCIVPLRSEQKDAGYADWGGNGERLPASVTVTNPWPDVISNELVFHGWPIATTPKSAKVVVVIRQIGTDNYGTYATIRLHNEQGGLLIFPQDSQHITGEAQAFKYPIGQDWAWGSGSYLTVTIVSDLVSTATVELQDLWIE